jgi:hypothetical protein
MPSTTQIDETIELLWGIFNTTHSLIIWLSRVKLGEAVSSGGVEGHLREIEDKILEIREAMK